MKSYLLKIRNGFAFPQDPKAPLGKTPTGAHSIKVENVPDEITLRAFLAAAQKKTFLSIKSDVIDYSEFKSRDLFY